MNFAKCAVHVCVYMFDNEDNQTINNCSKPR